MALQKANEPCHRIVIARLLYFAYLNGMRMRSEASAGE